MISLNRTAIVVRPGLPFLDWLHRADPTSGELNLEDLRREPSVYLLPECENEEAARKHLGRLCKQIFEEQLDGWYRVPSTWPKRRDLENFNHWFEWTFHSVVVDLCGDSASARGNVTRTAPCYGRGGAASSFWTGAVPGSPAPLHTPVDEPADCRSCELSISAGF